MHPLPLDTEAQRRAAEWAVALAAGPAPAGPGPNARSYERELLARYQRRELSSDQVLALLDAGCYHLLYRSHATRPLAETQLQDLLEAARSHNAEHRITGLLLHDNGCLVQVLEGPEAAVRALFARIRQDPRHARVVTISEGLGPERRFGHWEMAFGRVAGPAVVRAFETVLAQETAPDAPAEATLLLALLQAFGVNQAPAETPVRARCP